MKDYDLASAMRLVTLKLVGYTEVVHTLLPRLGDDAAILMFGGLARDRPYPGSTTVTPSTALSRASSGRSWSSSPRGA